MYYVIFLNLVDYFLRLAHFEIVLLLKPPPALPYQRACVCAQSCPTLGPPSSVARQASLPRGFPRQEYWSGLPFPPSGDLPNPRVEPESLASPALAGRFFTPAPGKPHNKTGHDIQDCYYQLVLRSHTKENYCLWKVSWQNVRQLSCLVLLTYFMKWHLYLRIYSMLMHHSLWMITIKAYDNTQPPQVQVSNNLSPNSGSVPELLWHLEQTH